MARAAAVIDAIFLQLIRNGGIDARGAEIFLAVLGRFELAADLRRPDNDLGQLLVLEKLLKAAVRDRLDLRVARPIELEHEQKTERDRNVSKVELTFLVHRRVPRLIILPLRRDHPAP